MSAASPPVVRAGLCGRLPPLISFWQPTTHAAMVEVHRQPVLLSVAFAALPLRPATPAAS